MTLLLRNLALALGRDETELARAAASELGVGVDDLEIRAIVRKSLDARRSRAPRFLYTLAIELEPGLETELLRREPSPVEPFVPPQRVEVRAVAAGRGPRPVVVGCGPAGLFAAWRLVEAGLTPVVVERGTHLTLRLPDTIGQIRPSFRRPP